MAALHRPCPAAPQPDLKLRDSNVGQGAGAVVSCERCQQRRRMSEAQGEAGKEKLPACRGRHPHLGAFDPNCGLGTSLMMMGASNLWFAATQSIIVMPRTGQEEQAALATRLRAHLAPDKLGKYAAKPDMLRDLLEDKTDLAGVTDEELTTAAAEALAPHPSEKERQEKLRQWDPVEPLAPEWDYPQKPSLFAQQENASGLMVTEMPTGDHLPAQLGASSR